MPAFTSAGLRTIRVSAAYVPCPAAGTCPDVFASPDVIVSVTSPPSPKPVCSDGLDNDGDTLVDLADPGCTSVTDTDESNPPPMPGLPVVSVRVGDGDAAELGLNPGTFVISRVGGNLNSLLVRELYGVGSADPVTYGAVAVVMAIVTMTACCVPTYRAMRVDPFDCFTTRMKYD